MKKLFLLIFFLLFCVSFVSAETTYPAFGGEDGDFFSDDLSKFNQFLTDDNIADVLSLSDPLGLPLVDDLDGDGVNEIVILDSGTIGFYHAQLDVNGHIEVVGIGGFSTSASVDGDYWSNMIIYDIDKDDLPEVIVYSLETQRLYIISWNGSVSVDNGFSVYANWDSSFNTRSADVMLGCGDVDGCIFVKNSRNRYISSGTGYVLVYPFNASNFSLDFGTDHRCDVMWNPSSDPAYCFPKYSSVPYDSLNDHYYFTFGFYPATLKLIELDVNSSLHCTFSESTNSHTPVGITNNCGRGVTAFSSPISGEFSNTDSGHEIGYGFMDGSNDYKLVVYKSNMAELDDYPEAFDTSGILISNPFLAKATVGTSGDDFCIVGYEDVEGKLTIFCAGKTGDFLYDNNQFTYFLDALDFNVSAIDIWTASSHAIESLQSNGISEVLTPYGVFELQDLTGNCYWFGTCLAYLRYEQPVQEPIGVVSVDVMQEGYEDLLGLTPTNFYYIDDGFINQNAYLSYCTKIDPCLDSTWRIHKDNNSNFTNKIRVTIIPTDPEGDIVSARAVLYQGEPNEQDTGWVANFSSGTEITVTQFVSLYPNETTAGSTLRLYWRDSENYFDTPNYQDFVFDVQLDGVVRGDCYTCGGITEEEYEAGASGSCVSADDCASNEVCSDGVCIIVPDSCADNSDCPDGFVCNESTNCVGLPSDSDNIIVESVQNLSFSTGVSLSVLVLIILGAIIFGIFKEHSIPNNVKLPASIIIGLVAFGVAVKIGLISYIWIILLILAILGGVAILVAKSVRG